MNIMGRTGLSLFLFLAGPGMWILSAGAAAETVEIELEYPEHLLRLSEREGVTLVRFPGGELLQRPGAPELPMFGERVVLPEGRRVTNLRVLDVSSVRIPCGPVRAAQPPAVLGPIGMSVPEPRRVDPDASVYGGTGLYPQDLVVLRGSGHARATSLASLEVHPVQFDPVTGNLVLHTRIRVELGLTPDPTGPPVKGAAGGLDRLIRRMSIPGSGNTGHTPQTLEVGRATSLDPESYQYVIITSEAQRSGYEVYSDWKTTKGIPATVVTVEWINNNYSGRDLPEKIRNFIIEAVDLWGTSYVLLGGDDQVVPSRVAWAMDCEAGFYDDENEIRADLYFSDLDGTWDANGNSVFGEVGDSVDLLPDVLVGRVPSDHLSHAQGVINKFLVYEKTPPVDYVMDAFFFAEILWADPYTDSGIGKDMIGDLHFGSAYEPIERQYESMGNESVASVVSYLDGGPHLANHDGHANYSVMGCGDGYMGLAHADGLVNGPRFFVLYSIGCWSAAFDYNCIGEHFVTNQNGGAIAFIGNSRYGWGSPGNPGWGYSETFDRDFWGAILTEGVTEFGAAIAAAKILRIPFARDENVYRIHEYQVNLLGDPEMKCHTSAILALNIDAPALVPSNPTQFTATVTDANGFVAGARVCLRSPDVYQTGLTDAVGQIIFAFDVPVPQAMTLTATAANHSYAETVVTAAGGESYLTVTGWTLDDDETPPSAGNGDAKAGAGETLELYTTVRNAGGAGASSVTGVLSTSHPGVTILVDQVTFGSVVAAGEATNATPFVFEVLEGCAEGEIVDFHLFLEDDEAKSWTATIPILIVAPGPCFDHYEASDHLGDGDGVVEPGETIALTLYARNDGQGLASPISVLVTSVDPNVTVIQGAAASSETLDPGGITNLDPPIQLRVEAGCAETTYGQMDIFLSHSGGHTNEPFLLAVGEPGLAEDMEDGAGSWTHAGINDLWHLTDQRCHSGSYSWYCGDGSYHYENNTNAAVFSPEFVVPENGELSFWCYYDVTTYGVDGMFVEILNDGAWNRLDYLGSGGALDSTLFVCDWIRRSYDLSAFTPGSTAQIRFWLMTDEADVAEGFYVDDVVVRSPTSSMSAVERPDGAEMRSPAFLLQATSPNPAGSGTSWRLSLPAPASVKTAIYDVHGRLVCRLTDAYLQPGDHEIRWEGTASGGVPVPAGVYFLRLQAGENHEVRKIITVR
jgi:hypothetical protein